MDVAYSENNNGTFFNLSSLDDTQLSQINSYINYVSDQENTLAELETVKNELCETFLMETKMVLKILRLLMVIAMNLRTLQSYSINKDFYNRFYKDLIHDSKKKDTSVARIKNKQSVNHSSSTVYNSLYRTYKS